MASKSTGTAGSLSKVEKSLNLKSTFPYRFTYTVYFLFGEMSIGDEGEIKSGPGFKAIAFCFFTSLNKSWDNVWFDCYPTCWCYLKIIFKDKRNHLTY